MLETRLLDVCRPGCCVAGLGPRCSAAGSPRGCPRCGWEYRQGEDAMGNVRLREGAEAMRLGVLGPWLEPWSDASVTWRRIEEIGFDVGYLGDHPTHPSLEGRWIGESYTTLAAVAQVTTRLEL